MTPITNTQLNQILLDLIVKAKATYPPIGSAYQLLYDTGARFHEITYLQDWKFIDNGHSIQYQTIKNDHTRIFPVSLLTPESINLIATSGQSIEHITYHRARNLMQELLSGKSLTTNQKQLSLHAFRHNFARQLLAKGLGPTTIQQYLGLKSETVFSGYLSKIIYSSGATGTYY